MKINIIPSNQHLQRNNASDENLPAGKTRVAAYCRVSTDYEEQESSYRAQIDHYSSYIQKEPNWKLVGIYADEGISGTGTRDREEFIRMISDCQAGRIDLVLTKSISRFARNTLDCLTYIRLLRSLNIPIIFEKENINTMNSSGELLITIMASIAQQESLSISQNVRMGIQYRFQQGLPMLNQSNFLGYTKTAKGELTIVPEEACVVRMIYREYLNGFSYGVIAQHLEEKNIQTPAGKDKWYATTIISMLNNEKYIGDLLLQKSYTTDYLTKKRSKNDGHFPQYYVKNSHDPIIPREIFMIVRGEMLRRKKIHDETGKHEAYRTKIGFHQKLVCGCCGKVYHRISPSSSRDKVWKCESRLTRQTECSSQTIHETKLQTMVLSAFQRLPELEKELQSRYQSLFTESYHSLSDTIRSKQVEVENMNEKITELVKSSQYKTAFREQDESHQIIQDLNKLYDQYNELVKEIDHLLQEKAAVDIESYKLQSLLELIYDCQSDQSHALIQSYPLFPHDPGTVCKDFFAFFRFTRQHHHLGPIKEYHDEDVISYIDTITIYDREISIHFKAGIDITIPFKDQ